MRTSWAPKTSRIRPTAAAATFPPTFRDTLREKDPARHPAPDVTALADPTGTLDEWFTRAGAPLALLRPGYAYAIFHPHETAPVLQRFAAGLGRPPA